MALLNLEALRSARITREPFSFVVVRDFIVPANADALRKDFPPIAFPGLLPADAIESGPSFDALIEELQSEQLAQILAEKFAIDLAERATMITVRGRCQEKDGRIHTDSETKLLTALLYFNDHWDAHGGRLRLLRQADNLDDVIVEVPPDFGTLVVFRRSDRSFHGHEHYVGVRRSVMINWMASSFAARRELLRHRISAGAKRAVAYAETAWM